ncbi:MAG: oligosaccharide flippase family protein, partial [Pseudomonadales bacterium]|nr:oligosaccharide flippase family protein [Pseudomonadales bacterium]
MSASLKVLKSGILLLGIQILQKGLGTISTLILARLLTPEHFGIVALVVIAIQFFEVLVDTGTQQYIVQKTTLNDTDLNTAWSLDISVKSAMCLVIMLSAPWIADFFEAPELTLPLMISALVLPLKAVKSPALMKLARDINYRPFFRLTLWQKAISFTVVVTYALIAPSHWAIISGNIVS